MTDRMDNSKAIQSAQLRQLLSVSNVSLIASVLLAMILAYMQREVIASSTLLIWCALMVLASLVRATIVIAYQRYPANDDAAHARLIRFRVGVLVAGVVWGSAGFLLFPAEHSHYQMLLILMLAGMTAGGVVSFSADLLSAILFSVSLIVPLMLRLFATGDSVSAAMGLAVMLYLGFMIMALRRINQNICENIILRLEAAAREETVRSSEERYRLLLSHSPVGIFHYDTNLVITYCNDRLAEMLNNSANALIGANMNLIKDQAILPALRKAVEGELGYYEGHYHATLSEANGWIAMTCAPSRDSAGKTVGGIAIVQDITGRKRVETDLRIAATAFESQEGMLVTDAANAILRVNSAFSKLTGYTAAEVTGRNPRILSSGRHDSSFYAAMWKSINDTGTWEGEIWNRRKNGEIYPEYLTISAVKDPQGSVMNYVGALTDISLRKETEAQLLDSLKKLEEKELAKTRFLAAAGHDLRQPVAAAHLFLDTLKLTSPTPRQSELIERLDQSMSIFSGLLERLLDISKFDAGLIKPQLSSLNLADMFNWLEQNFAQNARDKQLRFRLFFPMNKLLIVRTDIGLLQSVLMNLVSNAIKFTEHGDILISARPRGDRVLLQVWDTGIGIAQKNLPHIFDEFYQVANPQRSREGGLGLGLSICQRAMSLLGGEVTCRSHPGRGSVFELRLPLHGGRHGIDPLPTNSTSTEVTDEILFRQKSVVVVEDDALVAAALIDLLQGLGAEVRHFNNAEEALRHNGLASADFFIVDYTLGGELNGLQFLESVQQKQQTPIRAVILTGETSSQFISSVSDSHWPVLHKPINFARIAASLHSFAG